MNNDAPLILSLTDNGKQLGQDLAKQLCAEHQHRPQPFAACVQEAFSAGRRLILICASGIAVRTLAPVLKDKYSDPAVLVLDEQGQFVVPLISGHEGGANHWAGEVAELIHAQAVITSACQYRNPIYIAGMGCERNCPATVLHQLLQDTLGQYGLTTADLTAITSIDLKADEVGLIELANNLKLPFVCYTATDLRAVESQLKNPSNVVFKEVGCYGVAEGAALYHGEKLLSPIPDQQQTAAKQKASQPPAELYIAKHKNKQATVAIARIYPEQAHQADKHSKEQETLKTL